jgi:MIP family channel proteins
MEERGPSAYLAELLGTMMLVLFIALVLSVGIGGLHVADYAVIGLLHVLILGMLIATLGGASGAHFNPAVTITLLALRKIRPNDAGIYIVMQLLGAVVGAAIVKILVSDEGAAVNYGSTTISPMLNHKAGAGFLAELIGTFALMWAIMGTAVNPRAERTWAPLIIGGTLGAAVMCIAPLTGAGFNPARSFGPAVFGTFDGLGRFLIAYVAGPIAGALLAGFTYRTIVLDEQERLFGGRLVDADVPPGRVPGELASAAEGPGERPIDKLS